MERSTHFAYSIAWSIALLCAGSALVYKFIIVAPVDARTIPVLGALGSTHAHASLLVMDKNTVINFCEKKYMLASQVVHFEDNNCTVVHKHATGVTLDTFLRSIEVKLTGDCLSIPDRKKLCNDAQNTLRVLVNGKELPMADVAYYELQNNDHVLLNYGPEKGSLLRFKYNQVPNIPVEVNEPAS